jgi:hypothetical protein
MMSSQHAAVLAILALCIIASQQQQSVPPESGGKVTLNKMDTKGGKAQV